jgi:hypothetical protein
VNQDFVLSATPGIARRLLLLQHASKLDLSPAIVALAEQDRIDDRAFDALVCPDHPVKRQITQFLLDCDLRGVVQRAYHPEFNPLALLNVLRLAKATEVIVLTTYHRVWKTGAFPLPVQCMSLTWFEKHLMTIDRGAVVVYDAEPCTGNQFVRLRYLVREFPRFIIYDSTEIERSSHWALWARLLFPTMPHPLASMVLQDTPAHWSALPSSAFALFYNVCLFAGLMTADRRQHLDQIDTTNMLPSHNTLLKLF